MVQQHFREPVRDYIPRSPLFEAFQPAPSPPASAAHHPLGELCCHRVPGASVRTVLENTEAYQVTAGCGHQEGGCSRSPCENNFLTSKWERTFEKDDQPGRLTTGSSGSTVRSPAPSPVPTKSPMTGSKAKFRQRACDHHDPQGRRCAPQKYRDRLIESF